MNETDLILLSNEWERYVANASYPNSSFLLLSWLNDKGLLDNTKFKRNPYPVGSVVVYRNEICDVVEAPNYTIKGLDGDEYFTVTLLTRKGERIGTITTELELYLHNGIKI